MNVYLAMAQYMGSMEKMVTALKNTKTDDIKILDLAFKITSAIKKLHDN